MLLKIIKKAISRARSAKISIKLTVVYALMFSFILLILNASILYGVKFYLYNQANKEIDDVQTIMMNKLSDESLKLDLSSKEIFSDVPSNQNITVRIVTEDGKAINSSGSNMNIKVPLNKINASKTKDKHLEDKERHLVYKNIEVQNNKYQALNIQIIKDMQSEYFFMKILVAVMAAADFAGIIGSILLGYMASKRMLRPIDNITKTAENISINNLKERIEVSGPDDELKRLASTFNRMIDGLQMAFDRQTQFVSDASHELRTPIAVIQGYANLLNRWGKDDRSALEKSIYGIKFEADNMASLIEKLLFLAKGDSGTQLIEKQEFYLNELIDEVVEESRIINEKRLISSDRNEVIKIYADYKMIKQLLRIFIDNSIKFTPENGKIDISSRVQKNTVSITVSDTGIGIPEADMENIFERFYTVDKSRSKEIGGTGLGLSIAKWITDMHHGSIEVESEEGKGTSITVIFSFLTKV